MFGLVVGWTSKWKSTLLPDTMFEIFKRHCLGGGIKIENQENLGQCPNRGRGGKKKKNRNVPISIWEF